MLRVAVARFGEMDVSGWWNTNGMLGRPGMTVLSRGLAHTHFFAQARVAFTVAELRCKEVFDPPGSVTLWSLPTEIEDQLELNVQHWLEDPDRWISYFTRLQNLEHADLLGLLGSLDLLNAEQRQEAEKLRRSTERRAVPISGEHHITDDLVTLLGAGFWRGEQGQPAVPYAKLRGAG